MSRLALFTGMDTTQQLNRVCYTCHVRIHFTLPCKVDLLQMTGLKRNAVRSQSGHLISRIAQAGGLAAWHRKYLLSRVPAIDSLCKRGAFL